MYGNGYIESAYNPVNPSSLYRAQLAYRLNGSATVGVAPNAPILELPMADSVIESYTLSVSGICDRNAEKVFVYIDGIKREATVAGDGSCKYTLEISHTSGYHDICVTQVINGIESDKNATRTVLLKHDGAVDPPDVGADGGASDGKVRIIIAVATVGAVTLTAVGIGVFLVIRSKRKQSSDE
jgi:hypothetical protein